MRKVNCGIVPKEQNKDFLDTWTDDMVTEFYLFMQGIDYCIANFLGRMVKEQMPIGTYTRFEGEKYITYVEDENWNKICEPGIGNNVSESVKDAWMNYSEYLKNNPPKTNPSTIPKELK